MQMMQINTEFNEWRVCADVSVSGVTTSDQGDWNTQYRGEE